MPEGEDEGMECIDIHLELTATVMKRSNELAMMGVFTKLLLTILQSALLCGA